MSQKQQLLHQLLQEDQEPFHLNSYIADRRCQLKKLQPAKPNLLQVKKSKPISSAFQAASNFNCKNPCFFALTNSPDPRKSPVAFFDLHSPANKSPCRNSPTNAIFLPIPAKTASLLLEAALRIQKQSTSRPKSSTQNKINGFGLLGSFFKRLSSRNKKVMEIISPEKEEEVTCESTASGFVCSRNGRRSSTNWSGSSEDKSLNLDLESLSIRSSDGSDCEEVGNNGGFVNGNCLEVEDDLGSLHYDKHFCESPFHFVLLRSPSSGRRTPDFSTPASSPSRGKIEDKEGNDVGGLLKFQVQEGEEEEAREEVEEEDKEQCSPVSVLDPPFGDDDEGCDDQTEDDGFDLECSYAIVLRAKKQLLQKLHRFEKLAGLDPLELEKRMLEQEHEVDDNDNNHEVSGLEKEEEAGFTEEESQSSNGKKKINMFIMEELSRSSFDQLRKIPRNMKRLVSDLIDEEERDQSGHPNREVMAKRVCGRFESWKDAESNTIDMMVEMDFQRENDEWKRFRAQVEAAAFQIELGIFGLLMEELTEELAVLTEIQ